MADKALLKDPTVLAAIATWAAQAGYSGALTRGDAAAKLLGSKDLWNAAQRAAYWGLSDAQRLAFWASGDGLKTTQEPDAATVVAAKELFAEMFPQANQQQGFVMNSPIILALLAMMAAQQGASDAVARGDKAAKALLDAGQWNVVNWGLYNIKTPEQKLQFWASGEPIAALMPSSNLIEAASKLFAQEYAQQIAEGTIQVPVPMGQVDKPKPQGGGSGGLVKVAGIGAGLWLLSKIFGGK